MVYAYIRSLENCSPERDISKQKQLELIENLGILNVYHDEVTKENAEKEQLSRLMDNLKTNDMVVITKISRIAESFDDLNKICNALFSKGITLKVLELGELTIKDSVIPCLNWLNALQGFEKDIKYEKICKGHLISKNNQQYNNSITSGRPVKYSKKQLSEALRLRDRYTFQEIANLTGINKRTLLRASKEMQL